MEDEAAAALDALQAKLEAAEKELSIWKSVFPDIAPEHVLPDRSLLEAEIARLKALLAEASEALAPFQKLGAMLEVDHQRMMKIDPTERDCIIYEPAGARSSRIVGAHIRSAAAIKEKIDGRT